MKKEVKISKITIDKLAIMMNNGFESLEKKMATKEDLEGVKKEIEGVKTEVESVKDRLEGTNKRIDDFANTKVSKIQYKEIENRVSFMEKKLEIKK